MKTKANQSQYEQAVEVYSKDGVTGVFKFAATNGLTSISECVECEMDTHDTDDDCCLVCGSEKSHK